MSKKKSHGKGKSPTKPQKAKSAKQSKRNIRIILWFVLGVFASFLPIGLGMLFDKISGYDFSDWKLDYFSDYLLGVFAVSTNLCSCVAAVLLDKGATGKRVVCLIVPIFFMLTNMSLYSFIYRKTSEVENAWLAIGFVISLLMLITNGWIGFDTEKNP